MIVRMNMIGRIHKSTDSSRGSKRASGRNNLFTGKERWRGVNFRTEVTVERQTSRLLARLDDTTQEIIEPGAIINSSARH